MISIKCIFYCEVYTILDTDKSQKLIYNCIQNHSTVTQLPLVPLFLLFNTAGKSSFTWIVLSFFIISYLLLSASFRCDVSCVEYIWFIVTFVLV